MHTLTLWNLNIRLILTALLCNSLTDNTQARVRTYISIYLRYIYKTYAITGDQAEIFWNKMYKDSYMSYFCKKDGV